jgi:hypothetical protein
VRNTHLDPIVAAVRRVRNAHARRFNYEIHAICEDIRKFEAACGTPLVRHQPRKLAGRGGAPRSPEAVKPSDKAANHG